jgi:hypothetical protein
VNRHVYGQLRDHLAVSITHEEMIANTEDRDRVQHGAWVRTAAERRLGVVEPRRAKGQDRWRRVCPREAVHDEVLGQEAALLKRNKYVCILSIAVTT